jgi:hypothetical protein
MEPPIDCTNALGLSLKSCEDLNQHCIHVYTPDNTLPTCFYMLFASAVLLFGGGLFFMFHPVFEMSHQYKLTALVLLFEAYFYWIAM